MKTLALIVMFACCACHAPRNDESNRPVAKIVHEQEAAWNRGDLEAFMRIGYLNSPDLTFFSGGEDSRGFETMLARYSKRYKAEGKEMGRLRFTKLEVVVLEDEVSLARGRWDLDFENEKDVGGLFTLVFHKTRHGWRIVHDHTSVD